MARNSKNKKIARKNKRYRKGGPARLDMRKGGRVALQRGGKRKPSGRKRIPKEQRGLLADERKAALYDPKRPQPLPSTPLPSVRQVPIPEGGPRGTLNPNLKHPPVMDARQEERIRKAQEAASRKGGEQELLRGMQEAQEGRGRGRGRKGQPRPAAQDRAVTLPDTTTPSDFKRSDKRAFSAQQQGSGMPPTTTTGMPNIDVQLTPEQEEAISKLETTTTTPPPPPPAAEASQFAKDIAGYEGEYREDYDVDGDGEISIRDSIYQMQIDAGKRNPDGTPATQTDTATEETKPWWAIKGYASLDAALASGVYDADGNKIKDTYIDVDDEYQDEPQPTVADTAQEEDIVTIPPVTTGPVDDGSGGGYQEENGGGGPDNGNGKPPIDPDPDPDPEQDSWWVALGYPEGEAGKNMAEAAGYVFNPETQAWEIPDTYSPPGVIGAEDFGYSTGDYLADEERRAAGALMVREAAEGRLPEGAVIPEAVRAGEGVEDAETIQMTGALPAGHSFDPSEGIEYPEEEPPEGQKWAYNDKGERYAVDAGTRIATTAETVETFHKDAEGNPILDAEGNPIPIFKEDVDTGVSTAAAGVLPGGYSFTPPEDQVYSEDMPPEGERWAYGPNGERTSVPETTREGAEAARYTAAKVAEEVTFDSASGTINKEEDIAELNEKALTLSASGVKFSQEQKDRGIITKVTGKLDDAAKASAVKVAGTTLPKVLRAKEQLRKAGLTDEEIDFIGNDPAALEDRLMDFSDEQRGMVGNLPEEALMGKQIEGLLEGMESGEIPIWAKPAVSAVNQMLAARGLSASTVGRDNLFNAVIQAAMPIAQSNAQTIKESALQQIGIEAQAAQQDAQMAQQTAINIADKVFNLNMKQFDVDVQTEFANKKFLQTTSLEEVANEQRAVLQNAVNQTQLDVANLNTQERLAVRNADAFSNMRMTNLTLDQQGRVLVAQQEQQRLLSNNSAENAAKNFNAVSENQTNQFMTNMATQIDLNNSARADAMEQFNANSNNAAEARRVGIQADISKANAAMINDISKFNSQLDFSRDQWNAQNSQAVEMSNVDWRRKTNLANTAVQNEINMRNAMNAFDLSKTSMAMLWQELRDKADYAFKASENEATRKTQLLATALGNEGAGAADNWSASIGSLIDSVLNATGYGSSTTGGPTRD